MKKACIFLVSLLTAGCAMVQISPAISSYQKEATKVKLGDSKEKVLGILMPTQKTLSARGKKAPESYRKGNDTIEIYYFRSGWTSDGLTTDDEFTPYAFTNGILTSIGWVALGGEKTHGQVIPETNIQQTTIVN